MIIISFISNIIFVSRYRNKEIDLKIMKPINLSFHCRFKNFIFEKVQKNMKAQNFNHFIIKNFVSYFEQFFFQTQLQEEQHHTILNSGIPILQPFLLLTLNLTDDCQLSVISSPNFSIFKQLYYSTVHQDEKSFDTTHFVY